VSGRLESWLEAKVVREAQKLGWWQVKLMQCSKRGVPDRVFIRGGRVVWIEFKRPGGDGEPGKQQKIRHYEMRAAGAEVFVINSLEAALAVLR